MILSSVLCSCLLRCVVMFCYVLVCSMCDVSLVMFCHVLWLVCVVLFVCCGCDLVGWGWVGLVGLLSFGLLCFVMVCCGVWYGVVCVGVCVV